MRASILFVAIVFAGCTDPSSIECGTGWHWVSGNGQYVCVRDTGSTACPADAPYALDLDGGVACSPHPITGTIPPALCARIPGCGASADAGTDSGGAPVHQMGVLCADDNGCDASEHCIAFEDGRRCRRDCLGDAECRAIDPRSSCRALNEEYDGGPGRLSCTSPCSPIGPNECESGYQCGIRDDATYNDPLVTTCRVQGGLTVGTLCPGYHPDQCAPGGICTYESTDGNFRCRVPCDVNQGSNACAGGKTCIALPMSDALGYTLGHCI